MINFDDYTSENETESNSGWLYIPDHTYRILIIGGSGSGKTNAVLNLINNQTYIDNIYLYAKDRCEAQYQFLINRILLTSFYWILKLIYKMFINVLKNTI